MRWATVGWVLKRPLNNFQILLDHFIIDWFKHFTHIILFLFSLQGHWIIALCTKMSTDWLLLPAVPSSIDLLWPLYICSYTTLVHLVYVPVTSHVHSPSLQLPGETTLVLRHRVLRNRISYKIKDEVAAFNKSTRLVYAYENSTILSISHVIHSSRLSYTLVICL